MRAASAPRSWSTRRKGLRAKSDEVNAAKQRLLQQPRARDTGPEFHLDPRRARQRQHGRGARDCVYVCRRALRLQLPLRDVRSASPSRSSRAPSSATPFLGLLLVGTLGGLAGRGDMLASAAARAHTAVPLGIGAVFFWWAVVRRRRMEGRGGGQEQEVASPRRAGALKID